MRSDIVPGAKFPDYELTDTNKKRRKLSELQGIDPMIVIRWKGIYEALEDAVDACETAAHRVGNILVKNA